MLATSAAAAYDRCMTQAAYVTADAALFGKMIQRLRMAQGWTIAEFARRSGYHKNHLSVLERGRNIPSLEMLFTLAEIFRIDASDMVREVELARRARQAARAAAMLAAAGLKSTDTVAEAESAPEAEPPGE